MNYLDLTLPSAAANLACDEALLDLCDEGSAEVLRFWEPNEYFVVLGYANSAAREVNAAACERASVGIHRRCSGGGTVLQGPGCLNYSLVLNMEGRPSLQTIPGANRFIMERQRQALNTLLDGPVEVQGHTDLCWRGLKFSGNAQRRKRRALLFHGTFLLRFDLRRMAELLPMPSRQPEYRHDRAHEQFLTNLPLAATAITQALRQAWSAETPWEIPLDLGLLLAEKYSRPEWNLKF